MKSLIEKIQAVPVANAKEKQVKDRFITFITTHPDCLLRSNLIGHLTSSAFIVDPHAGKILLIHHKKLDKWLQPGGHCDGEADTLAVAIKEVFEETGVTIERAAQEPVDLDIHTIPFRKNIPEHEHYDVRYLFEYDSSQALVANHESLALAWIGFDEIRKYTEEESVLRILGKINSEY